VNWLHFVLPTTFDERRKKMKVIEKGREQKGWAKKFKCTGEGNKGGVRGTSDCGVTGAGETGTVSGELGCIYLQDYSMAHVSYSFPKPLFSNLRMS
jgi:hypothetical protein